MTLRTSVERSPSVGGTGEPDVETAGRARAPGSPARVQVLPSPDHLLSRSRSLRLSIHFNFWASDQIMKPCLIKQHGAKQMGPLVTARKIAPLTQITVESVLMTTGGSISAPNTTDYSGLNYNLYKQRSDINIKMNHSNRRLVRIYFSFN